jgi:4-aminobutyrate aminotransferase/(S)-3-amino-2-methylpropionate transaminase
MGSGMPIAAVLGKADVMDAAGPSTIGGTYNGNPVCCAASLATIQYMKDLDLNNRAKEIGRITLARFQKIKEENPFIGDVRGLGAMNAIEFVHNGDPSRPYSELCENIVAECAERGLILIGAGTFKNIIRILSPLVITNEELNKGLDILEEVIRTKTKNNI